MYTRVEVYEALDEERDYQDTLSPTSSVDGQHTVPEWVLYMGDYIAQARQQCSRIWGPESDRLALDTIRKITAMGVACMEQNGVVHRGVGTPTPTTAENG